MYVIAGLGNPGLKYEHTRHNSGFDALDILAKRYDIDIAHSELKAVTGKGYIEGQKVILVKPVTYMNLSGDSIRALVDYYKINVEEELIVLYDDIALAPGQIRVRGSGSAGGHNGMKDIIAKLGRSDFTRVRIGVGEKPPFMDLADYVLGHFSKEDAVAVDEGLITAADAVRIILTEGIDKAMNAVNRKVKESDAEDK